VRSQDGPKRRSGREDEVKIPYPAGKHNIGRMVHRHSGLGSLTLPYASIKVFIIFLHETKEKLLQQRHLDACLMQFCLSAN
jgi:hypothetical protein